MNKNTLTLWDFIILSIIFFAYPIYSSTLFYFYSNGGENIQTDSFSDFANQFAILTELIILFLAGLYLFFRKFNWSQLDFSVNVYTFPCVILLLILGGLAVDTVIYGLYWWETGYFIWDFDYSEFKFPHLTFWLLIFACLNGFYEEVFFMGITFLVEKRFQIHVLIGSMILRFAFHTYQGIGTALGITLMGLVFILIRQKISALIPFIVVHALFDMFGAGIATYFLFLLN